MNTQPPSGIGKSCRATPTALLQKSAIDRFAAHLRDTLAEAQHVYRHMNEERPPT